MAGYTIDCIQHWLDIVDSLNADYYIVCDNCYLKYKVLNNCCFRDTDIKFISSYGISIKKAAKNLYTGKWEKTTHALLTPFYHTKQTGIKHFWNIDADDTTILLSAEKIATALKKITDIAVQENISAVSLDMWLSRTKGKHWSFGITFINNNVDYTKIFHENQNLDWISAYRGYGNSFNLDWFFTYLRDNQIINIKSFFIDNCMFIHWGDFLVNPFYSWVNIWKDGKVHYPIFEKIFMDKETGTIDNFVDYKISVDASIEEGAKILESKICHMKTLTEQQQILFNKKM